MEQPEDAQGRTSPDSLEGEFVVCVTAGDRTGLVFCCSEGTLGSAKGIPGQSENPGPETVR